MSRGLRLPSLLIWLTAVWIALWGDLTLGNAISGLIVAVAVLLVARPTGVTGWERTDFHPLDAVVYAVYFLYQMVKSNLIVAREIITPGSRFNRAIIGVQMRTSSPALVTLVANSITLTPGTVTIDVAEECDESGAVVRRILFIHVLHFDDIESVRRGVQRLEHLAMRGFGSRAELAAVEEQGDTP